MITDEEININKPADAFVKIISIEQNTSILSKIQLKDDEVFKILDVSKFEFKVVENAVFSSNYFEWELKHYEYYLTK